MTAIAMELSRLGQAVSKREGGCGRDALVARACGIAVRLANTLEEAVLFATEWDSGNQPPKGPRDIARRCTEFWQRDRRSGRAEPARERVPPEPRYPPGELFAEHAADLVNLAHDGAGATTRWLRRRGFSSPDLRRAAAEPLVVHRNGKAHPRLEGRRGFRSTAPANYTAVFSWWCREGIARNLSVRRTDHPQTDGDPKARPLIEGFEWRGLVLANKVAQGLLRTATLPTTDTVWIAEGETDWLRLACFFPGDAVLGIRSGSWTDGPVGQRLAARIPPGAIVRIATDNDRTGDRYAEAIARTLPNHNVWRARPR